MSRNNINFFLRFPFHILKITGIRIKDYLSRIVEENTRTSVGEKIAETVFWRVINPFFNEDFLIWGLKLGCVVKVVLLISYLREVEVVLCLELSLWSLVRFHSSCIKQSASRMKILLAIELIILLVLRDLKIWRRHELSRSTDLSFWLLIVLSPQIVFRWHILPHKRQRWGTCMNR